MNVQVGGADGAHHTDLACALQHVDAHCPHQAQSTDDRDQDRHDHHEIHQDVGGRLLAGDEIGAQLCGPDLDAALFEESRQLVIDPLLCDCIVLIRQHPQGIDLSRCANQVAEIFIIHIQERRVDIAGDGIETHDVPLCFLAIDLDGQPVADLQVGEYVE